MLSHSCRVESFDFDWYNISDQVILSESFLNVYTSFKFYSEMHPDGFVFWLGSRLTFVVN